MDTVVLGIGNPLLADDRAGIVVVEDLEKENLSAHFEVLYTVGFEVIDKVLGYKKAIIVDACKLGNPVGTILEVGVEDIFSSPNLINSHAISVGTTLKTGYTVFKEEMPSEIKLYLIEVQNIEEFSKTFTPEVKKAVEEVKARIRRELS